MQFKMDNETKKKDKTTTFNAFTNGGRLFMNDANLIHAHGFQTFKQLKIAQMIVNSNYRTDFLCGC